MQKFWDKIMNGEVQLESCTREELIDLLQWNDSNGCYIDELALNEIGTVLTKEDAINCFKREIEERKINE